MPKVTVYRWRIRDPITRQWHVTGYVATAETMLRDHPEALVVPVPGSREERDVREAIPSAEQIQRGTVSATDMKAER